MKASVGTKRGFVNTTFALQPDWPGSGYWAFVIRNFLLAFASADPCQLWIPIDRRAFSVDDVLCLLGPLTASFGEAPFAKIVLEDDPEATPPGRRVIHLPTGSEMATWTSERFRSAATPSSSIDGAGWP